MPIQNNPLKVKLKKTITIVFQIYFLICVFHLKCELIFNVDAARTASTVSPWAISEVLALKNSFKFIYVWIFCLHVIKLCAIFVPGAHGGQERVLKAQNWSQTFRSCHVGEGTQSHGKGLRSIASRSILPLMLCLFCCITVTESSLSQWNEFISLVWLVDGRWVTSWNDHITRDTQHFRLSGKFVLPLLQPVALSFTPWQAMAGLLYVPISQLYCF